MRSDTDRQRTVLRFDSVTELLRSCNERFPDAKVETETRAGEFVLHVHGESLDFTSMIAHFEGSRCYMVEFPTFDYSNRQPS